jgi:di/tricarboxylate transporter
MSDITISFAVLAAAVVLFVWNRFPVELVAVAAALTLWATGVLDLQQAFAGSAIPPCCSSPRCSWSARAWTPAA